jgi:hypothetical protein
VASATFALTLALASAVTRDAAAYTIETALTQGCHESISTEALRRVRSTFTLGLPLPSTDSNDAPLVDDLPFAVPSDMKDIGGATLLIGVRDNDIKNLSTTALDQLAQLTADSATQREHCLRAIDEKEPDGTRRAVADCRAFIKEKLMAALDGLLPDGSVDVHARDSLDIVFALRGEYSVNLPRFYLRMGQAIHAIQDSFTHTFRNPLDQHKIHVTLDWIDYSENKLDEAEDGPPHMTELDRCDDPDDLRAQKHVLAIEASASALHIGLDPTMTRDAKSAAFDALLDTYVAYEPASCSFANGWCNAPENQYRTNGCGCGVIGARAGGAGALLGTGVGLGLVIAFARRRKGRRAHAAGVIGLAIGAFTSASLVAPRAAMALEREAVPKAPEHVPQGPVAALEGDSQAAKPGARDPAGSKFGRLALGAAYDHPALAVGLGGKYQLSQRWMVGVDVEWNPWIQSTPTRVRAGTGNAFASIVRRYQLGYEAVNFRTTGSLGISTLLVDLPGANKWSVGPLVGLSFLGVEWKVAPGYFLVVDPTYLIVTVPHLTGTPLSYFQYRFQVGLEFGG